MELGINVIFALILGGGWAAGKLLSKLRLPGVLGMVIFGILCSVLLTSRTSPVLWELAPFLKSFALMVILLRAGLGISRHTLKKVGLPALLMAFVPCLTEGFSLMVLFRIFFGFNWAVSGLTGFMLAAVSPAVVVPSMLDLKEKGHDEIPTMIISGASIDDVFAITFFSVFLNMIQGQSGSIASMALSVPVSLIAGIACGAALGFILSWFFSRTREKIRATEKMLVILAAGTLLVQVGDTMHFAALLGIMTAGFILLERNEPVAHELSRKLSKLWIFAEIILFVLIGYSLDVSAALQAGMKGLAVISLGLVARSAGVFFATAFSGFTLKERLFCMIAYIPKATVQAALGGVALSYGIPEGNTILAIAVTAILFTAPLGLFGIRFFSSRLLSVKSPGC